MGVAKPEVAAVQRRHRRRQAETEAGTGLGAARLQPHEALHRMPAIGLRNSRAVIGDAEQHLIAVAPGFDQDLPAIGRSGRAQRLRGRQPACRI